MSGKYKKKKKIINCQLDNRKFNFKYLLWHINYLIIIILMSFVFSCLCFTVTLFLYNREIFFFFFGSFWKIIGFDKYPFCLSLFNNTLFAFYTDIWFNSPFQFLIYTKTSKAVIRCLIYSSGFTLVFIGFLWLLKNVLNQKLATTTIFLSMLSNLIDPLLLESMLSVNHFINHLVWAVPSGSLNIPGGKNENFVNAEFEVFADEIYSKNVIKQFFTILFLETSLTEIQQKIEVLESVNLSFSPTQELTTKGLETASANLSYLISKLQIRDLLLILIYQHIYENCNLPNLTIETLIADFYKNKRGIFFKILEFNVFESFESLNRHKIQDLFRLYIKNKLNIICHVGYSLTGEYNDNIRNYFADCILEQVLLQNISKPDFISCLLTDWSVYCLWNEKKLDYSYLMGDLIYYEKQQRLHLQFSTELKQTWLKLLMQNYGKIWDMFNARELFKQLELLELSAAVDGLLERNIRRLDELMLFPGIEHFFQIFLALLQKTVCYDEVTQTYYLNYEDCNAEEKTLLKSIFSIPYLNLRSYSQPLRKYNILSSYLGYFSEDFLAPQWKTNFILFLPQQLASKLPFISFKQVNDYLFYFPPETQKGQELTEPQYFFFKQLYQFKLKMVYCFLTQLQNNPANFIFLENISTKIKRYNKILAEFQQIPTAIITEPFPNAEDLFSDRQYFFRRRMDQNINIFSPSIEQHRRPQLNPFAARNR